MENKLAIDKLNQHSPRAWVETAQFLLSSEETGGWSTTHKSFTDWLIDTSKKLELSESSLWRYFRAAKFYLNLKKDLERSKITVPDLTKISAKVSPENLEILEKIQRVTLSDDFLPLAERVIHANIKRDELRTIWMAYRKSLDGKTSRGAGVSKPKINLLDPKQQASFNEAQVLVCLNSGKSNWIKANGSTRHKVIPNFCFKRKEGGKERVCFDAMVVLENDRDIEFHAIEVKSNNDPRQVYSSVAIQENYCDFIWIAFCEFNFDYGFKKVPTNCGILKLCDKQLEIIREPVRNNPANKLEISLQTLALFLKG